MIRLVFIFVLTSNLVGCKGLNSFYIHDRFQRKILQTYPNDTLFLSDYLICNNQRQMSLFEIKLENRFANEDSILYLFSGKIKELGLISLNENGENLSDTLLCHREQVKVKHILKRNYDYLKMENLKGQVMIIPFFQITDLYRFTGFMTSNLVAGDGGFMNFTSVSLIIFIIKGGEVIYSDHRRYASRRTMANSLSEVRAIPPAYQVKEQHTEELVRRAMKRYIKRLEK